MITGLPRLSLALVGSFFLLGAPAWLVADREGAETGVGAIRGASGGGGLSADGDIDQTIFVD
ncbi:hypothetical protein DNK59_24585 [Pseudomonas sp. TKO26]|nr:hypothetical protein DNK62_24585 [Pseudomonas sp. TKO30]PYY81375.1 hypothetical protein DNK61_23960 [Pseudomonas sp. TKO29]PYY83219.1 hypothetical protein DNK59_24585 [Pseudomonas sp. TKO26]PYY97339.1 hypothetical protein DNK60_25435 [Pseudomonas sp. TKO14]